MIEDSASTPRRSFFKRLALLAAPIAGARLSGRTSPEITAPQSEPPSDGWLLRLTGKHRTMFDVEKHRNGHALGQANAMLDVWHRNYRLDPPRVNVVLGARGTGIPILLSDAAWGRFHLGEQYEITRPGTKDAYDVNPFSEPNAKSSGLIPAEQTVEALQRRGVVFLACRNTIAAASKRFSTAGFGTADDIQQAIEGALLPGVVLVPAMLIAFTQMEEKGISYIYAG